MFASYRCARHCIDPASPVNAPKPSIALARYLSRHIAGDLPKSPPVATPWQHVLVIPAYAEHNDCLKHLEGLSCIGSKILVIYVINRPDNDPDANANTPLRRALLDLPASASGQGDAHLRALNDDIDVYLLDAEMRYGCFPADAAVGLARKYGCDLALSWMAEGSIDTPWICTSDADALLPTSYFSTLQDAGSGAAAACFPFWHQGDANRVTQATCLYELRLHHYVLGLEFAGSPYAYHTLGSCIAVHADHYAQVRGFPQRAGGEDFYLLNKLAKTGPILRLQGEPVVLQARESDRVPFGTGPAVAKLLTTDRLEDAALFYHPACFEALRAVLAMAREIARDPDTEPASTQALHQLSAPLATALIQALDALDFNGCLAHCRRQSRSEAQFLKQFHQWLDGFRTLKVVHAIRDAGWPDCSLLEMMALQPWLWPTAQAQPVQAVDLRAAAAAHWQWQIPQQVGRDHMLS